MPASDGWQFWLFICLLLTQAPFFWYANQVGHEAVEKDKTKAFGGRAPIWVKYAEVKRLAKEGSRFAKVTLVVMKIWFVLPLVATAGIFLSPVVKRLLNIEW